MRISQECSTKKSAGCAVSQHILFKVETTGFHVNPAYPHLGASPDGLVSCSCCDNELLEIKRPYNVRHTTPLSAPYLEQVTDGVQLSRKHDYFYQIQGQLAILERPYCHFVCWTPHSLHIEHIIRDPGIFFLTSVSSCKSFLCCMARKRRTLVILVNSQVFFVIVGRVRWGKWFFVIIHRVSMDGFILLVFKLSVLPRKHGFVLIVK